MLKSTCLALAAMAFAGCAVFEPQETVAVASSEAATAPLQPVALNASPRLRASQPIGLAPCAKKSFAASNCWRKGDGHYVFEDPVPDGLQTSPLAPPSPVIVRN